MGMNSKQKTFEVKVIASTWICFKHTQSNTKMNDAPPPSKRQRIDPNAMDDDDALPAKGQSILGKRKRKENNAFLYNHDQNNVKNVEQGAPSNHPQNAGQFMNPELKENSNDNNNNNGMIDDDDDDDEPHIPRVTEFHKGHQLDIKITDEHQETFWTTGIICRIQENKVLIHVPRSGAKWMTMNSDDIAPPGTYTDGLN